MSSKEEIGKVHTFEQACELLQKSGAFIFINYRRTASQDIALAEEISDAIKKFNKDKPENKQLKSYCGATDLLPGQDWDLETQKGASKCTHAINIVSPFFLEAGYHNKLKNIVKAREPEFEDRRCIYYLASNERNRDAFLSEKTDKPDVGLWTNDDAKMKFMIQMLTEGPGGPGIEQKVKPHAGYEAPRINWSKERFYHLLENEVTVQELADIAPEVIKDTKNRFTKLVIVNMDQETYHDQSKMGNAFRFSTESRHGFLASKDISVTCMCGQCGTPRDVYQVDKPDDIHTQGVLIVRNEPCKKCGTTSSINPVPGNTLQTALDKIFAK